MNRILVALSCLLALLLVGANGCGGSVNPPVTPGTGGAPAGGSPGVAGSAPVDAYARCAAAVEVDPGTRNVIVYSGESLSAAIVRICSDPSLQACFADGRCQ